MPSVDLSSRPESSVTWVHPDAIGSPVGQESLQTLWVPTWFCSSPTGDLGQGLSLTSSEPPVCKVNGSGWVIYKVSLTKKCHHLPGTAAFRKLRPGSAAAWVSNGRLPMPLTRETLQPLAGVSYKSPAELQNAWGVGDTSLRKRRLARSSQYEYLYEVSKLVTLGGAGFSFFSYFPLFQHLHLQQSIFLLFPFLVPFMMAWLCPPQLPWSRGKRELEEDGESSAILLFSLGPPSTCLGSAFPEIIVRRDF